MLPALKRIISIVTVLTTLIIAVRELKSAIDSLRKLKKDRDEETSFANAESRN